MGDGNKKQCKAPTDNLDINNTVDRQTLKQMILAVLNAAKVGDVRLCDDGQWRMAPFWYDALDGASLADPAALATDFIRLFRSF